MDRKTKSVAMDRNERAQVHGARSIRVSTRSPTRTADGVIRKQQFSKSLPSASGTGYQLKMHELDNQPTASSVQMSQDHCVEKKQQPDVLNMMNDEGTTVCDNITISVEYFDAYQKKHTLTVRRSCTIEDYMKWRFILSSQVNRDQFNVNIVKELGISGAITVDSIMYLQQAVSSSKDLKEMCDRLIKYAIGYLGQGVYVTEIHLGPDQLHKCVKEIDQKKLNIYYEVLGDCLYFVSGNRDKRQITDFFLELDNGNRKQSPTSKRIDSSPVWIKMAKMMQLENVLKRHCQSTELEVSFETHSGRVKFINLTGPEKVVSVAEEELKHMEKQMQHSKCKFNVTSKFALTELQVEAFLDKHLSNQNIKCVTQQTKDRIYVYGFNSECLCKAKGEIEAVVIEKTCIVKGYLKHKKDMLISYLTSRWPGKVVIHIEDSGFIHIVGVKKYVEDAFQKVNDLNEGRIELNDLQRKQTHTTGKEKCIEADSDIQTGNDESEDIRKTKEDENQEQSMGRREKQKTSTKVGNDKSLDKEGENRGKTTGNVSDERRTEKDIRGKMIPNKENNNMVRTSERNISTAENKEDKLKQKNIDDNAGTKRNVEKIHEGKQNETEQTNISRHIEESDDRSLKYLDVNKGTNTDVFDSRRRKTEELRESKMGTIKNTSHTKEHEAVPIKDYMNFSDEKVWRFMMKTEARIFLNECANEKDVSIHVKINHDSCSDELEVTEEVLINPKEEPERTVLWQMTDKKKMVLTMKRRYKDTVDPGSRFVLVKFGEQRRDKEPISIQHKKENEVTVAIRVPSWKGGNENEKHQLMDLLTTFVGQMEEADMEHALIPLETICNWPEKSFLSSVITKAVDGILFKSASATPNMVTLFLRDETMFEEVLPFIKRRILKCSQAKRAKQNKLQVVVTAGELDKTKADVIVNTTSKDLDLSNGKVSATLLKAAGGDIQTECKKKYPKGISRQEVAVTGGHKLNCENVFHIALDRYIAQQEMKSIESIRSFMITCLEKASDMNHTTIAFPAVGTGVLKYPIDLVASAMFESVERFKSMHTDTSLTSVFFVIYPSDVKVMEIFRKNEETLGISTEVMSGRQDTKVEITITGLQENVSAAKVCLSDRCEDELYDPSYIYEYNFPGVPYQIYLAVGCFFEKDIKAMSEDCIKIYYQENTIYLSGKRKEVKRASDKMKGIIDKILSHYHFASVSVQGFNRGVVEEEVSRVNRKQEAVCIFDKFKDIVQICVPSTGKVRRVRNSFIQKLEEKSQILHSEPTSLKYNWQDNGCYSRKSVCGEDTREKRYDSSLSSTKERKKIIQRPRTKSEFSWTRHADNVKSFRIDNIVVRVYEADILCLPVECIVNPANKHLDHSGGLAFTIAKAADDTLEKESAAIVKSKGGSLAVSSVVFTRAGKLDYKCILHAVGPCWYDYSPISKEKIKECLNHLYLTVINCFMKAEQNDIERIAIPTISSGLFGVPKELCAIQYAEAIRQFSSQNRILKEIHIVDISQDMINIVQGTFDAMLVHGETMDLDWNRYIQMAGTQTKYSRDVATGFKNTARDKPGSLKTEYQTRAIIKKTNRNEEKYEDEGTKLVCTFSSNHMVQIYEDNILKLKEIQALVCSENRRGEAQGEVSEQLLEVNGRAYEDEKAELFKSKLNYGDVATTSGGKSNFTHIIHAITPPKDIKALHMMYFNIFEEVLEKKISCLAIPLLGTGTGNFGPDESAQVLLEEWAVFCSVWKGRSLNIHLVLREKTISDLVKCIFRNYIDGVMRFIAAEESEEEEEFKHDTEHSDERVANTDNENDSQDTEDDCVICMDKVIVPKRLKCGHTFCTECIEGYFRVKKACPTCGQVCGVITGDQPDGQIEIVKIKPSCAGYEDHRTLALSYYFPPGTQGEEHPRPDAHYRSISRTGYLPDTKEGREVCAMLKVAFERRLVFTIGTSRTTGEEGVITWNDIHHKTDMRPNTQFGYPDKTYLQRVREELAVKGVTEKDIEDNFIKDLKADHFRRKSSTDTTI